MNNEKKYVGRVLNNVLGIVKNDIESKSDKMKQLTPEDVRSMIPSQITDPYYLAPEGALSNWEYKLDDVNNVVTLLCYVGWEEDVIVYTNYQHHGKTYKTKLDDMSSTFLDQYNIKSIVFSKNIDTSNVINTANMFLHCSNMTSLNLSNFDTSNVTDMNTMFTNCSSLTSLDLTSFDIHNVIDLSNIFGECSNLTEILVSRDKWVIKEGCNTYNMFSWCGVDHVTYVD